MTTSARTMTADDLLRMPDDGMRHELIRGVLTTMPPAGDEHGDVASGVAYAFMSRLRPTGRFAFRAAETGFLTEQDPDTVRAPDFAVTRRDRLPAAPVAGYSAVIPDVLVEVRSPSDRTREVTEKVDDWLRAGCRVVVVVEPNRSVTLHRESGSTRLGRGDLATFPELDDLSIPVAELLG
jgi:Uma2 family endonuclease